MKRKLHILIHAMGMPVVPDTLAKKSLGGSETAAVYQARELAKLGHQVELWTIGDPDGKTDAFVDGVSYTSVGRVSEQHPLGDRFEKHASYTPHDVLIIQRHPIAFHKKWAAKICIWQLHDLARHSTTGMIYQGLWQTNAVTVVSEWHKRQVIEVYGIKESAVHVIPNGVDLALYDGPPDEDVKLGEELQQIFDEKFVLLYQSRPERGKDHLVRPGGIMDQLKDTNAYLLYCTYDNAAPQMEINYARWDAMAQQLPNVASLGALTKAELAEFQKRCQLAVYPTEFEEVSCISAMECMAAGLPMLTSDVGALKETCAGAGVKLIPLVDGKCDEAAFVTAIRNRIKSPATLEKDRAAQRLAAESKDWFGVAMQIEALAWKLIHESQAPTRLMRHGFEHSDIQIARHAGPNDTLAFDDPHSPPLFSEFNLYEFASSPEAYKAHYDLHGGKYYDSHEEMVIGEDVSGSTRFAAVAQYVGFKQTAMSGNSEHGSQPPMRFLDYGCAHGHYLIPLARVLSKSEFFGVDINERAIGAALKWALRDKVTNVTLSIGTIEAARELAMPEVLRMPAAANGEPAVEQAIDNRFDLILAGEVLEHVPNPEELIANLRRLLKPDGWLIGTTPVGRWEWTGTEEFRKAREHLWHFSKEDLQGMFEHMDIDISFAPAGNDRAGGALGSYVWRVVEDKDAPAVAIPPIADRIAKVVPRQTVSACLIVKNGEKTLRSCIDAIVDWVDEIVIGIDPTTTDRTREIVAWLKADYPLKPFVVFDGLSATTDGFDEARNKTLEAATGDWILWLDADETLKNPWELWKFLKDSAIDAIGIGQVHYSSDPPKVLNIDYPNRLFRRSSGAKFYGLVHEHPEVTPGKSIPNAIIRHEARFLHNGYVDEETRRGRYHRNMPLLKKDIEKHPDRVLNKFLLIRDLVQEVTFDIERNGNLTQAHAEQLQSVATMWEQMLTDKQHVRMIIDGLEYYSIALRLLDVGFEQESQFRFSKPPYNDLTATTGVKGRFRTRDVFNQLILRISEETTRHYESKYL